MRHAHQYCRNFIIHCMKSPQRTCIIVNYWSISPSTHWRSGLCCHNGGPCVNMDAIIMVWTTTECTSSQHPGSQMVLSGIQRGESVSEEDRFCRRRPWSDFIREVGSGGGSIVLTQSPTNSYVNLQGGFLHRAEILLHWACKKSLILVKKCN